MDVPLLAVGLCSGSPVPRVAAEAARGWLQQGSWGKGTGREAAYKPCSLLASHSQAL